MDPRRGERNIPLRCQCPVIISDELPPLCSASSFTLVLVRQVYPGLVKSNFMERAEFFGPNREEERKSFRQQVREE
jgi:hypothetical protein